MDWITEAVITNLVTTIGVVLAAGIPAYYSFKTKLTQIGEDAAEAREQTANTHTTNLREELDVRHELIVGTLSELSKDIRGVRRDHLSTRQDIGQLRAEDRAARRETQGLRQELRDHIKDTEPLLPTLERLVERYSSELHNDPHTPPKKLPE